MLDKAYEIWQAFVALPSLWQGWEHARTPVAFYTDAEAVLFSHPDPPPEFQPITIDDHTAHVARPKPRTFTANTNVDLNGVQTATIMWANRPPVSAISLTAHEAFHAYQQTQGFPFGNVMLMSAYPVYDPLINALGEAEAKLLRHAILDDDLTAAKQALDARATRQALLSPELRGFEDGTEYQEGTAVYIELKAQQQGGPNWQQWLDFLSVANHNGEGADRHRFYASGMAYGLLLDRYLPGWHTAVAKDWPALSAALAEALGYQPNPDRREFAYLDFTSLLREQEQDSQTRQDEMRQRVSAALPGTGLRVDATFTGTPIGGGWHPFRVRVVPGQGRFHPTMFSYIYDNDSEFRVESGGLEPEMIRRVVFERPDLDVTVDGRPFSTGQAMGCLEIRGSDSYLKMTNAQVKLDGNSLVAVQQPNK